MPRNISQEALDKLIQTTGLEPVNIIRIQWIKDGQYHYYSDRRINDQSSNFIFEGKFISLYYL